MEIIQHIEHPSMRPQDIDLIEHVKYTIAQNYTSLFSRIDSHIEDEKRHITEEERTAWNSKVDKLALYEIEQKLVNKANRTELIELQETLARLKSAVDAIDSGASTGFVTESELQGQVQLIKELINSSTSGSLTPSDLNELSNSVYRLSVWKEGIDSWKQAMDTWKDNGGGTQSVDLSNYYTKAETDLKLTNYYSKSDVDELIVDTTAAEVTKKDIDDINDAISNIHTVNEERINEMIDGALEEYKGTITGMDQKIADLDPGTIAHVPATWDDDLESYVSYVIKSYEEGDGASWSSLKQSYDSLTSEVTSLRESIGEDGSINLETLQSNLESRIDEKTNTAITNLTNEWALKDLNNEDSAKKLKWAISGFTSEVNDKESLAKLYNDRFDGTNNAVTALYTKITTVDGKIDEAIAGLFAEGGEGKASVTTAVRDGISSITEDAKFINMVAEKVSINSDVHVVHESDGEDIVVADINHEDGTAEFMNGRIKISDTGYFNESNVRRTEPSVTVNDVTSGKSSVYGGQGISLLRNTDNGVLGTIYSTVESRSNIPGLDNSNQRVNSIGSGDTGTIRLVSNNLGDYYDNTYNEVTTFVLTEGYANLYTTGRKTLLSVDGVVDPSNGFMVDHQPGITQDVETLNGTLHINGGIITGFQGHDNNMHIELVDSSANINADVTSATANLRSYYKASGSSIVKPMSWTCSTNASWVTSVSPNSGNGISFTSNSETISFVLQPNTSTSSRTATITFTSATNPVTDGNKAVQFTVTQAGKEETPTPTSTYDFRLTSNSSMTFTEDSGSQEISYVNTCTTGSSVTNPEVTYKSSDSSWLTATVGATGGYVRCKSNGSAYDRTGTITITQSGSNNKITINVTQSHTSEDVYILNSPQSGQTLTLGATSGSTADFSITSYKISNQQTVAVPVSPYVHLGTSYFGNIQSTGSSGNTYYYTVSTLSQNDSSNYRTGFIAVTQPGSNYELVINLQQENTEEVITYSDDFGFTGSGLEFEAADTSTKSAFFESSYDSNRHSIEQYGPVTVSTNRTWIHPVIGKTDEYNSLKLGGYIDVTVDSYSSTTADRTGTITITQTATNKTSTLTVTQKKVSNTKPKSLAIDGFVYDGGNQVTFDGHFTVKITDMSSNETRTETSQLISGTERCVFENLDSFVNHRVQVELVSYPSNYSFERFQMSDPYIFDPYGDEYGDVIFAWFNVSN